MEVTAVPGGVRITVRVRPRARGGLEVAGGVIVVRVGAPPEGGRATEEARRALAAAVSRPPSAVSLVTGARSRTKVFEVSGIGADDARRALAGRARQGP